jgi:hypothetical protein
MLYSFKSHNELNKNLTDYISTVTDKEDISKIPIESINDFLNGLESFLEESASN